ncbi:MAG: toxin HicA [Chloroflexi bacterium]|nr:toxin HicA [Chloroflexota bacterium]
MTSIQDILATMRRNPKGVSFNDLCKVCDHFFGENRQTSGSHRIYKTPWQGDPRVNIQNDKGMAKAYQVRQVLKAIERLTAGGGDVEEQDNVTK